MGDIGLIACILLFSLFSRLNRVYGGVYFEVAL